ncbi:MAG TPA: ABC transporter substrate-binding protein [bacterium]|nr:ABC transporter substrate-binding protein [bacterium]
MPGPVRTIPAVSGVTARRRTLTRRGLLAGAAGLGLAAAGPPAPWTQIERASAAPTPRRGGTFRIPVNANITPWPPIGLIQNLMVNNAMFNKLVRLRPADWAPEADLAERWEVSKDGLTWTFHLKSGVRWHDGHPFTADDVKYTIDAYADPKINSQLRGNFEPVTGVEVVDPLTVRVATKTPYSSFLELLCYIAFIMPKHLLEGQEFNATKFPQAFLQHPVGTGPFKFGEHVTGDHFTVTVYDNYHEGRPYLDAIIYKVVRDLNSTVLQVKTGELDIAFPTVGQIPALAGTPTIAITEQPVMDFRYFGANYRTDKSPTLGRWWGARAVRQAFAHAINTKGIIQQVARGRAELANGPIPSALKGWYVKDAPTFDYDPERAKKMLYEAGFRAGADGILAKDGRKFVFTFNTDQGQPERIDTSLIVQQNLRDIGIDVRFQPLEFTEFVRREHVTEEYEAFCFYYIVPQTPDLHSYFQTNGSLNIWGYSNAEIDRLFLQGLVTFNAAKRREIYARLYRRLAEEQAANFLYHPHEIQAINKRVQGWPATDYRTALAFLNRVWLAG